jgi:hypothetical protein
MYYKHRKRKANTIDLERASLAKDAMERISYYGDFYFNTLLPAIFGCGTMQCEND